MKKTVSLVLGVALAFGLLASCSRPTANPAPAPAPSPTPGTSTPSTPAPAAPEYILRVGATVQSSSPGGQLYYNVFEPYVEEHSNGRIDVQVYMDSTMGNDAQLTEALQLNTIEMAGVPTSALANFCPDFMALDLPFLYADKPTVYAALDGDFGDTFFSKLEERNIMGLSWSENGFRNISSNYPIRTLDDMKGLKIRVMEAPVYLETMKAFGANPTPMAFNELYTGLSQGTVDGQDNGIVLTYSAKFYEVQKFYTVLNYVYAPACNLASKAWWDTLPADLQQVVLEGAALLTDGIREVNQQLEAEYIQLMEAEGVEFIYLDESERNRFREACSGVYDVMRAYMDDPSIVDLALAVNDTYGK